MLTWRQCWMDSSPQLSTGSLQRGSVFFPVGAFRWQLRGLAFVPTVLSSFQEPRGIPIRSDTSLDLSLNHLIASERSGKVDRYLSHLEVLSVQSRKGWGFLGETNQRTITREERPCITCPPVWPSQRLLLQSHRREGLDIQVSLQHVKSNLSFL